MDRDIAESDDALEERPRRQERQRLKRDRGFGAVEPARGRLTELRRATHAILEGGAYAGSLAIAVDVFLVVLIVANVAAGIFETVPEINNAYGAWFDGFETVSVVIFSAEYVLRVWSSVEDPRYRGRGPLWGRVRFALQPVALIDFFAIAPSVVGLFFGDWDLRVLRVFRLLRILKIVRYSPALTTLTDVIVAEWRALMGTLLLLLCVMILSAELMYLIEGAANPKSFGTLPQAMYWAITTLTTVGYGDNVPVTALGKIVTGITMIMGLGLFALPVGIVATNFVNEIHRRDFVVTWSMLAQIPLFKSLDVDTVVSVMTLLRSQVVREHSVIQVEGAPAQDMYFVISGRARGEYPGGLYNIREGDYFGESAVLRGQPCDSTVTARTDMRLLTLSANDLAVLIRKFPRLKRRFEQAAQRRQDLRARPPRAGDSEATGAEAQDMPGQG
jgi:voltage-gated potassium channel